MSSITPGPPGVASAAHSRIHIPINSRSKGLTFEDFLEKKEDRTLYHAPVGFLWNLRSILRALVFMNWRIRSKIPREAG